MRGTYGFVWLPSNEASELLKWLLKAQLLQHGKFQVYIFMCSLGCSQDCSPVVCQVDRIHTLVMDGIPAMKPGIPTFGDVGRAC